MPYYPPVDHIAINVFRELNEILNILSLVSYTSVYVATIAFFYVWFTFVKKITVKNSFHICNQ